MTQTKKPNNFSKGYACANNELINGLCTSLLAPSSWLERSLVAVAAANHLGSGLTCSASIPPKVVELATRAHLGRASLRTNANVFLNFTCTVSQSFSQYSRANGQGNCWSVWTCGSTRVPLGRKCRLVPVARLSSYALRGDGLATGVRPLREPSSN